MKDKNLYRGEYFITLYQNDEEMVGTFDNAFELANFLNKRIDNIQQHLSHIFKGNQKSIFGYDCYFYKVEENEEK